MLGKLIAALKGNHAPDLAELQRDLAKMLNEARAAEDWEAVEKVVELLDESADVIEGEHEGD
jgi:hypothetical protein